MGRKKRSNRERNYFIDGVVLIGIGLIFLYQGSMEGAILFFVMGIGYMAYTSQKRQDEVWDFFWGGIQRFLRGIFSIFRR